MKWEADIIKETDMAWETISEEEKKNFSSENYKYNYRAEHNELVLSIGIEMGMKLNADMDILTASILLHDIGRAAVKKGHGEKGAEIAAKILGKSDFPDEKIDAVKYAIRSHVGWDESIPDTLEAKILWDADKLSKLGASIILQKAMRLPMKGKKTSDAVEELNNWLKKAEYIKEHMKTEIGMKIANERFQTLKLFVESLNKEYHKNF